MRLGAVLLLLLLFAVARAAVVKPARPYTGSTPDDFVWWIAHHAADSNRRTGIPASVTIAQAALESGWGRSRLTREHHNLFGVKAGSSWRGRVVSASTWEVIDGKHVQVSGDWQVWPNVAAVPAAVDRSSLFRVYESPADSLADHARVLYNGYYAAALQRRDDSIAFAHALTGVYATDPEYGDKLARTIMARDLMRWDVPASSWQLDAAIVPPAWRLA